MSIFCCQWTMFPRLSRKFIYCLVREASWARRGPNLFSMRATLAHASSHQLENAQSDSVGRATPLLHQPELHAHSSFQHGSRAAPDTGSPLMPTKASPVIGRGSNMIDAIYRGEHSRKATY